MVGTIARRNTLRFVFAARRYRIDDVALENNVVPSCNFTDSTLKFGAVA